jgi:hypothetical protein
MTEHGPLLKRFELQASSYSWFWAPETDGGPDFTPAPPQGSS